MQKPEDEFDQERIKIYMSQTTESKLRHLEETKIFFDRIKDDKTKKINEKLKAQGF